MTEFEKFYQAFLRKLDTVRIPDELLPGAESASWDRKAAYLLYLSVKKETGSAPNHQKVASS